jgi:cyclic pyranopterin monophosphate synthase
MAGFTHFDEKGSAHMVNVGDKVETERSATATARVVMLPDTLRLIKDGKAKKGDVLGVARLAGIMAAKKTPDLIPLCHPLALTNVSVEFDILDTENAIDVFATCKLKGRTGVEMEALTAATITALTIYDMCKAVDKGMEIVSTRLLEKSGGKSGTFKAK